MGEILAGNDLRDSGYPVKYAQAQDRVTVCRVPLDQATLDKFAAAVS
jgi:hypothetical protein